MPTKESGQEVILQISDGGSPTNFVTLRCQQDTNYSFPIETDDVSCKGDGRVTSVLNVAFGLVIDVTGIMEWVPEDPAFQIIRLAVASGADVEFKAIVNAAGDFYQGFAQVTQFDLQGPIRGASRFTIQLTSNGAITSTFS
jgi:TP901-1 family phage major tail protein